MNSQNMQEFVLDALKKLQETAEGLNASGSTRDEYITSKEAAKRLNISLPTLHSYSKSGIIPKYYLGNRVLYKVSEIELAPQKAPSFRLKGQKL
jgi:excisionase family DNA binding protein